MPIRTPDTQQNIVPPINSTNSNTSCSDDFEAKFEEALINLVVDELLPVSFIESAAFHKYTNGEWELSILKIAHTFA